MYVLKKLFQLRDKTSSDTEKPFLDHLEDLRIVVTRVVLTLTIATVICFVYRDTLMSVLRRPVDTVWLNSQQALMPSEPEKISSEDWDAAKKLADTIGHRPAEVREAFFAAYNQPVRQRLAALVDDYRAAMLVPEERRDAYLTSLGEPAGRPGALAASEVALLKQLVSSDHQPDAKSSNTGDPREMSTLTPTEGFMLSMKLAFFAGIVISFPLLLYFILLFVLPGLKNEEKRVLWPALVVAFGLFIGGVLFAYFLILPQTLKFFFEFSKDMGISNDWRIGNYISFATQFTLLFGLAFELPVVVMAIVKLGLLRYETMRSTRAYALLAIFIAAAILTPTPDALTLILMAGPMYLLYEGCIWMAWGIDRKERRAEEHERRERMQRLLNASAAGTAAGDDDPDAPLGNPPLDDEYSNDSDPPESFLNPDDEHTDDRDPPESFHHPDEDLDNPMWQYHDDHPDAHGNYGIDTDDVEGSDELAEPGVADSPAPEDDAQANDDPPAHPTEK
jgi:sec-independent protein translocase protein TatC